MYLLVFDVVASLLFLFFVCLFVLLCHCSVAFWWVWCWPILAWLLKELRFLQILSKYL